MLAHLVVLLALIAPRSGTAMCALTAADFHAAGVAGTASKPVAKVEDAGAGARCVYAGQSSATGGIELDVFYPAGANPTAVMVTYVNALGDAGAAGKPIPIPGADEARWAPDAISGGPAHAIVAVRRGALVFVLGMPTGKNARAQLSQLAEQLLKRF